MRLLLCAPLLSIALAGCSASGSASVGKTVDAGEIEQGIAAALRREAGVTVDAVDCPVDISAKVGTTFECVAKGEDGTTARSTGSITGKGRYKARTPVINTTKIESIVARDIGVEAGAKATLDCPDLVQLETGAVFTCKARAGDRTRDVTVTQKDDTGNVRYEPE